MKITSLFIFLGFSAVVESFVSTPFLTKGCLSGSAHPAVAKEGTLKTPTKTSAAKDDKTVETVRKPELIAKIAEKSGLTKADTEVALAAFLDTISEVSLS